MPAVDKLYAYVADDDGLMAFHSPSTGWMPLVGIDEARMQTLYPIAKTISKASGKTFRVLLFENPKDVTARFTGTDN